MKSISEINRGIATQDISKSFPKTSFEEKILFEAGSYIILPRNSRLLYYSTFVIIVTVLFPENNNFKTYSDAVVTLFFFNYIERFQLPE